MHANGDVLGDEGRKALDACVKVKIYGRPENTRRYLWKKAVERLQGCYEGTYPCWGVRPWFRLHHLLLPPKYNEISYDIIDIHDGLVNFDEKLFVEKYPEPESPRYVELKNLIDERRADVERECKEATAYPDGRHRYSWLVAQRRVRDCFVGSFAGDEAFFEEKRNPNEPYSITEIYDAVVGLDKVRFFEGHYRHRCGEYDVQCTNEWWKKSNAQRDDIEREFREAKAISSNADKVIEEYSRDEAEKRVKDCYGSGFFKQGIPVLPIKRDNSGLITQTYNIFDIHNALCHFDEKKLLQKYPEDEGPGSEELKKSIEQHNCEVKKEYLEAKQRLHRYSKSEAEQKVKDCFVSVLKEEAAIFPMKDDEKHLSVFNQRYDIFDIHKAFLYFDNKEKSGLFLESQCCLSNRVALVEEYQEAKSRLHGYSKNEAERRVRDCFAGTRLEDTDIFPTIEDKNEFPKMQQTYDIFEIKKAIEYFDAKKFFDKYPEEGEPEYDEKKNSVDEKRAEIEKEYAEATKKVEIEHGSGFIIHDHFVITSKHVIVDATDNEAKEIHISNAAIGELPCEVLEDDGLKDLALLYCENLNLKQNGICPLQLSNQSLLPGMQTFCFGYPMSYIGETAIFLNGYVSGSKEIHGKSCSLNPTMAVLNCSLNFGNSGGPVLCWDKGQFKVVGVVTQKNIKDILTIEERKKIDKIRESLQTSTIPSVPDDLFKNASLSRDSYSPRPDPCQTPLFLLTLKLYDALETHTQFNLGKALPGHYVVEFIKEAIKRRGDSNGELTEVVKWSEDFVNILPSGHRTVSECCIQ